MSMSDCPQCWETPCRCGFGYRSWSDRAIDSHIDTLEAVKKAKKEKCTSHDFADKVRQYKEIKQ